MIALAATAPTIPPPVPITKRHVAAAVIGNALEFYDFTTYAFFATSIGQTFFPDHTPFASLMLSLATFGAGFIGRPLGALVIGSLADRKGRRPALLLSFALMGFAILGLALTPSYASIGIAAPILALVFRLIQGFAIGGEVGPTMAYLIEAAPRGSRGLYGAWQSAGQSIASLMGGLVGVVLASLLDADDLQAWGWRIAFLLGTVVLPFGWVLRRTLPETIDRHEDHAVKGAGTDIANHMRIAILGLVMIMSFTTSTYVFLYLTTYAITTLHIEATTSFGATAINGAVGIVFTLLGGFLSDKFGRKPIMIIPRILFLLTIYPAFYLMVQNHDGQTLFIATAVIGALSSMSVGAALILLTESFRKEIRSVGVALIYAIAVTIFGGATQLIITWLIEATGSPLAPAWYMMATTAAGIVAMLFMHESVAKTGSTA